MKREPRVWWRVFEGALVGTAPYVKNMDDVDELVARARMLADKASSVVAPEDSDAGELPEEEPFPLVRRSSPPAPASGSFLFDGPGHRDVDELEARR